MSMYDCFDDAERAVLETMAIVNTINEGRRHAPEQHTHVLCDLMRKAENLLTEKLDVLLRRKSLNVACETCKADVGWHCHDEDENVCDAHPVRVIAAGRAK